MCHRRLWSYLQSIWNKIRNLHVILLGKKRPHGVTVCGMQRRTVLPERLWQLQQIQLSKDGKQMPDNFERNAADT